MTTRNTVRMNSLPRFMAMRAPRKPPVRLARAMQPPRIHRTSPCTPNTRIEARLVVRLAILAATVPWRNPKPRNATIAMTKKDPVPGPRMPS